MKLFKAWGLLGLKNNRDYLILLYTTRFRYDASEPLTHRKEIVASDLQIASYDLVTMHRSLRWRSLATIYKSKATILFRYVEGYDTSRPVRTLKKLNRKVANQFDV